MIEVQIAGRLTRSGVDSVRWVLMEGDTPAAAPVPAAPEPLSLGPTPVHRADAEGRSVRAQLLRLLVGWLALAGVLALALATAVALFGRPTAWRGAGVEGVAPRVALVGFVASRVAPPPCTEPGAPA